jgi:hypothetical protein
VQTGLTRSPPNKAIPAVLRSDPKNFTVFDNSTARASYIIFRKTSLIWGVARKSRQLVRFTPESGHVLPSVNSTGVYLTKCPALFVVKPQILMQRGTF